MGSGFFSAPKSGSARGPLVADMPGAGCVAGMAGGASAAGAAGAAAWVGFASVAAGASVAGVWAETAVGGAGATAPTGSGARECQYVGTGERAMVGYNILDVASLTSATGAASSFLGSS
jgi:hypothetical protein